MNRRTRRASTALAAVAALALGFGAQQLLAQHRGLWTVLEARRVARVSL